VSTAAATGPRHQSCQRLRSAAFSAPVPGSDAGCVRRLNAGSGQRLNARPFGAPV